MIALILAGAAAPTTSGDTRADRAREVMAEYTRCLVKTQGYKLRPLLDHKVGDPKDEVNWARYASSSCLGNVASVAGETQLSFKPSLMRGGIYEALYHKEFDAREAVATFDDVAPIHYPIADTLVDRDAITYAAEMSIGDCTVRGMPTESRRLIDTPIASAEEAAAVEAIVPALSGCITKGQTLNFSRSIVRGMIAEALYRLSVAKKSLTHAQG